MTSTNTRERFADAWNGGELRLGERQTVIVPPARWGCLRHWFALPRRLRLRILGAFEPGQEITKTPSEKYVRVALEVQDWISSARGIKPEGE